MSYHQCLASRKSVGKRFTTRNKGLLPCWQLQGDEYKFGFVSVEAQVRIFDYSMYRSEK